MCSLQALYDHGIKDTGDGEIDRLLAEMAEPNEGTAARRSDVEPPLNCPTELQIVQPQAVALSVCQAIDEVQISERLDQVEGGRLVEAGGCTDVGKGGIALARNYVKDRAGPRQRLDARDA